MLVIIIMLFPYHDQLFFFPDKVKAWLADKDAEALRCQKLLVEEEEAAQKRYITSSTFSINLAS